MHFIDPGAVEDGNVQGIMNTIK